MELFVFQKSNTPGQIRTCITAQDDTFFPTFRTTDKNSPKQHHKLITPFKVCVLVMFFLQHSSLTAGMAIRKVQRLGQTKIIFTWFNMQLPVSTRTGSDGVHLRCHANNNNALDGINCSVWVNEGMCLVERHLALFNGVLLVVEDSEFLQLWDFGSLVFSL